MQHRYIKGKRDMPLKQNGGEGLEKLPALR